VRVSTIKDHLELLERGLATSPLIDSPLRAMTELELRLRDPDLALFVQPHSFLIAENNRSEFLRACCVIHFYAEQRGELRELLEECMMFGLGAGLSRFHGCDINELSEAGYRRLLKGMPRDLRRVGVLYQMRAPEHV
jgi:hypothetical protein